MKKQDYKKIYRDLYSAKIYEVKIIKVPKMNYLMISGHTAPKSTYFNRAIKTLYDLSYKIKFNIKNQKNIDYIVMPLEALWSTIKDQWQWTLMIMQPEYVNKEDFEQALAILKTNNDDNLLLDEVKFVVYEEGQALQTLHCGSYKEQTSTISLINNKIKQLKVKKTKLHHEIYLNDPNRISVDKLKTIIRQPYENL